MCTSNSKLSDSIKLQIQYFVAFPNYMQSGITSTHSHTLALTHTHTHTRTHTHTHTHTHSQIKRHKVSSGSMESTSFSRPSTEMLAANPRDRLPTPPFPGISSLPPSRFARRKSIAVMEPGQRHITAVGCLQINVKVPELAAMERQRKQSWSMVVGGTDSRSVGTGLNELDRVIGGSGM